VNESALKMLEKTYSNVMVVTNSYSSDKFRRTRRTTQFVSQLMKLRKLLRIQKVDTLYISLNAGFAIYFDLILLAVLSNKATNVILHHHSYKYINNRNLGIHLVTQLGLNRFRHIFLCRDMEEKFNTRYFSDRGEIVTQVISNHFAVDLPVNQFLKFAPHSQNLSIGYLGRVNEDKGFVDFIKVAELSESLRTNFIFKAAGPCGVHERHLLKRFMKAGVANRVYVGEVLDSDKFEFLDSIDVLLFPSNYAHEAQSLVVLEAQSRGVVVVARERGCLQKSDIEGGLIVLKDTENWTIEAFDSIGVLAKIDLFKMRQQIKELYARVRNTQIQELEELLNYEDGL
jgi:glycosyltransferase involved in cell wall biosynthesis